MDALVLSGGEIKGAWQAGAIEAVYASGFRPHIVTGISVGALNAAHLAAHDDGKMLAEFWETEVTSPAKVVRKRKWYELVYRVLFKKWDGVVDTKPLTELVGRVLGPHFPRVGDQMDVRVGAVNLETGELVYTPTESPDFLDAVLASAAEPIALPLRKVAGVPYYDGGLRDIAPLKQAIVMGATRIVAIVCQPANVGVASIQTGNLMGLIGRVLGIATNEIVRNDFERAEAINQLLAELPAEVLAHPYFAKKRPIPITVIRPAQALGVDLESFTHEDIKRMVEQGRQDARRAMGPA